MAAKSTLAKAITRAGLKKLAGEKYFERGVEYFEAETVIRLAADDAGIHARVQGTEFYPYTSRLWLGKKELDWGCTCPLGVEGEFCKHLVATGLAWLAGAFTDDKPEYSEALDGLREHLKTLDKPALIELLWRHAASDEQLLEELMLATRATRKKSK